jgi:hypothetical protein
MTSMVLEDLKLESLTPSVNALLVWKTRASSVWTQLKSYYVIVVIHIV